MSSVPAWLADRIVARLGPRPDRPGRTTPLHWSFLLGHLPVIALVILAVTGLVLTLFYRPSAAPVLYDGAHELFRGRELPHAYASVLHLSHDVPGGIFLRRLHAVAAHLFIAAGVAHLLRVIVTGAFRHPRQVNYLLGLAILLAGVAAGWTGENLTYSLVAGNSLRVGYAILSSVPVVGEQLATLAFGGPFPAGETLLRLWGAHVVVLPGVVVLGTWLHLRLTRRLSHTQMAHPGIDDRCSIVGEPFWPGPAARLALLSLLTFGMLVIASILVPWSDLALEGPYRDGYGTVALYPPWYLFWPEGAMILLPAVALELGPVTLTNVFIGGVVVPGVVIAGAVAYPAWDGRRRERPEERHVCQDPRAVPIRVGTLIGATVFLAVLTIAAGSDAIAHALALPVDTVIWALRAAALLAPFAAGAVTAALVGRPPRQLRPAWSTEGGSDDDSRASDGKGPLP